MCANLLPVYYVITVVLMLVERQGNQQEKQLNVEIATLIGRRTCMHEFDTMGAEVLSN